MDFMKKTLNQVNLQENTLYDFIYNLVFFISLKESEDDIKNGQDEVQELLQKYNAIVDAKAKEKENELMTV